MKDNIQLLSTRSLDDALIEKASYNNITIEAVPFIEVKKLVTEEVQQQIKILAGKAVTVVFTSMNAVEVVIEALPKDAVMPRGQYIVSVVLPLPSLKNIGRLKA